MLGSSLTCFKCNICGHLFMSINCEFHQLKAQLELHQLVDSNKGAVATVAGLSFKEIQNCCSLSNKNFLSLFFHRLIVLYHTGRWTNDAAIGIHLFYNILWVNSAVIEAMHTQHNEKNPLLLAQIELIDCIFKQIVNPCYTQPALIGIPSAHAFATINRSNSAISRMFPVKEGKSPMGTGALLASHFSRQITKLKEIMRSETPDLSLIQSIEINKIPSVLSRYRGIRNAPPKESTPPPIRIPVSSCSLFTPFIPTLRCHHFNYATQHYAPFEDRTDYDITSIEKDTHNTEEEWWTQKTTQQKIALLASQRIQVTVVKTKMERVCDCPVAYFPSEAQVTYSVEPTISKSTP
jgi:hypothetical protein